MQTVTRSPPFRALFLAYRARARISQALLRRRSSKDSVTLYNTKKCF